MKVEFVGTEKQLADMMTKQLAGPAYRNAVTAIMG